MFPVRSQATTATASPSRALFRLPDNAEESEDLKEKLLATNMEESNELLRIDESNEIGGEESKVFESPVQSKNQSKRFLKLQQRLAASNVVRNFLRILP